MSEFYWNEQAEYLKKSRSIMWNMDYMEFLIKSVWKINKPVNIADFGCGLGYLAAMLMPLLQSGSTYTGFDKGDKLLKDAKECFENAPFETNFILKDLLEDNIECEKFDIVICQTILMHVPEPGRLLDKMIQTVKKGGLVICIEMNWNVTNAALYIDGIDVDGYCNLGILQKLWVTERERKNTDKSIGLKIPVMMQKAGLHMVGIRANDCVRFVNPLAEAAEYEVQKNTFLSEGWGRTNRDEYEMIENLCGRGLSKEEANLQFRVEKEINEYVAKNKEELFAVAAPSMFITYGRK